MPQCCVIPGCTIRYYKADDRHDSSISFHELPNPSHPRYQRWISFIRDIRQDGHTPGRNARLCSRHFVESDFSVTNIKRRLKSDAVPSRGRDFNFIECKNESSKEVKSSDPMEEHARAASSAKFQPSSEEVAQAKPVERPLTDSAVSCSQEFAPLSDKLVICRPTPIERAVGVGALQKFVVLPKFRSILPKPQPLLIPVPTIPVEAVEKPRQEDVKNNERLWSHFILNKNGYEAQCRTCGQI